VEDILLEDPNGDWCWKYFDKHLLLETKFGTFRWETPPNFEPHSTHTDLFMVANEALLSPWFPGMLEGWKPSRKPGTKPGLSLSGGIDSTACYILMPDNTVLLHHRRSFESLLKHEGADHLFEHIRNTTEREVYSLESDHELIRKNFEKPVGFSTDLAACVHLILFADHFDLRGIALGMPIDNTYLWHGYKYRDFSTTHWWKKWSNLLQSVGLDILLPIAGLSEAAAVHIVKEGGLDHVTSSCLRAPHPGCGLCWKCFLKNGMLGHPFSTNSKEVNTFLSKRPLKTSTHALWRIKELNRWDLIPDLIEFQNLDLSWWMEFHPDALDLLPHWIRKPIENKIRNYFSPMDENSALFGWNLFPNSDPNSVDTFIEFESSVKKIMGSKGKEGLIDPEILKLIHNQIDDKIVDEWEIREVEQFNIKISRNSKEKKLDVISIGKMPRTLEQEAQFTNILDNNSWRIIISEEGSKPKIHSLLCKWAQKYSSALIVMKINSKPHTVLLRQPLAKQREAYPLPQEKIHKFPSDIVLSSPQGSANDYYWLEKKVISEPKLDALPHVSIVIPVYNRRKMLGITLAAIENQTYPIELIEVVVSDDGSSDLPIQICDDFSENLNIRYVRQQDLGYRASAARNLGIRTAKNDLIILLDGDVAPVPGLVEVYVERLVHSKRVLLCGHRRYVDANHLDYNDLRTNIQPLLECVDIHSDNSIIQKKDKKRKVTLDWRIPVYAKTRNLLNEKYPFRACCSGNLAFHREVFDRTGGFDEDFTDWGAEDTEWGFRVWNRGHWIVPVWSAIGIHQEPEGGRNETDREAGSAVTKPMLSERVPLNYREEEPGRVWHTPMVSIYMPAYNAEKTIVSAVQSALNQTFTDIEICIVDDGSTDDTTGELKRNFGHNPRVRWKTQTNGGISSASNAAIRMCRGPFIGQLDSDDLLQPDAVENTLRILRSDDRIGVVYGSHQKIDRNGEYIGDGYNWPRFSREKLLTGMIIHHFRIFRARDYWRTTGFSEDIMNAVDYDFFLKMSEVTEFHHLDKWTYLYRIHSNSTSISNVDKQDKNNLIVLNRALERRGLKEEWRIVSPDPKKPRDVFWTKTNENTINKSDSNALPQNKESSAIRRTERFLRIGRSKEIKHIENLYKKLRKIINGMEVGIHATEAKVRPWLSIVVGPIDSQILLDKQKNRLNSIFPSEPIVTITTAARPRKSPEGAGVTRIRFGNFQDFETLLIMKKKIEKFRRTWTLHVESITDGIHPSLTIVTGKLEKQHAEIQLELLKKKFPNLLINVDHDAGR